VLVWTQRLDGKNPLPQPGMEPQPSKLANEFNPQKRVLDKLTAFALVMKFPKLDPMLSQSKSTLSHLNSSRHILVLFS
jgi:hypothetical protein